MADPLRLLIVEDSEDDALLLAHELRKGGFAPDFERVDSAAALEEAVRRGPWDIVITDHNMPGFSSEDALALVRASGLDVPVIIVSGSIGEEIAVAAMRSGAQDYLRKDNLSRLVPAVSREVREAHARQAHRRDRETIRRLSSMDSLTGIANRAALEDRLRDALRTVGDGTTHALLYIDIDQFKVVNDTCGHLAGDRLLQQVARLLHEPLREGDFISRLGGDEFGLLLTYDTEARARAVADRLLQSVRDLRFAWKDRSFSIGVSIGLVMMHDAGQSLADVLRAADLACFAAKDKGRGRVHVYHPEDSDLQRRHGEMEWVSRLRQAMDEDRFELHCQHVEALHPGTSNPRHCEFLVRLRERSGELVMPGVFIPAAERYNLMPTLDRWIVASALGHLRKRAEAGRALATGRVFLNLSGSTLGDDGFVAFVKEEFVRSGVAPSLVCFEITETAAITHLDSALNFISEVHRIGCRVALDDFGAGLSSFSYLKLLGANYLKIDGGFVRDMLTDPMNRAIVEAINSVGHVAGLETIAEWVESAEIRQALAELGIDYAQGYAIARPEPLPAFG